MVMVGGCALCDAAIAALLAQEHASIAGDSKREAEDGAGLLAGSLFKASVGQIAGPVTVARQLHEVYTKARAKLDLKVTGQATDPVRSRV